MFFLEMIAIRFEKSCRVGLYYLARDTFWSLVGEGHQDQIYIHVGHLVDGVFDLAGKE